ncbi:Peptidylarginine deiminase precursor [Planctomycetes bacterium CA13]|uniref:Peptidylarginine deiminase n=1 Tax=Novipirellula herctigrandis TaxID=2527986 RepID=A0A5C5YWQ6_9BACT|nr:Peptidylarginine deiminase precursor [Planctomycetes bacterium CA13]
MNYNFESCHGDRTLRQLRIVISFYAFARDMVKTRLVLLLEISLALFTSASSVFGQYYGDPAQYYHHGGFSNRHQVAARMLPQATAPPIASSIEQIAIDAGRVNLNRPYPRIAGEFEPQRAMVVSVSDWQPHHAFVLQQIVAKTAGHTNVLVLCNNSDQLSMVVEWLLPNEGDPTRTDASPNSHVFFCEMEVDTIWMRDFGPLLAETETGTMSIDFFYEGTRPKDDALPAVWADRTGSRLETVRWTIQGGNLLNNGRRLALTTHRIFEDNRIQFPNPLPGLDPELERRKMVIEEFTKACNLTQLVVLEHLENEATHHVDMFATFLAPDHVVVAQLDPRLDPVNSAILERNAARLRRVKVDGKPMQVHRIVIPPREGTSWSAYTNVILANDLVLMPIFDSDPLDLVQKAKQAYQRLLPDHRVETVDMTTLKALQGELHCLSMNLPVFAATPDKVIDFKKALQFFRSRERPQ